MANYKSQIQNDEQSNIRICILFVFRMFVCSVIRLFFLCCFFCQPIVASCQPPVSKIDSLLSLLKTAKEDTNKVNILNALGRHLKNNNPDTAIILTTQALSIAENLKWKIGIANSIEQLGVCNWIKADYPKSLGYYFRALKMEQELGRKDRIASNFGNIGIIYRNQGDHTKALDYYFKALTIDEKIGNKNGIARHLGNIGIIYEEKKDYTTALDYYFRRLKIDQELGNKGNIAINLGNIGIVFNYQANIKTDPEGRDSLYNRALDYYFKALKMKEELGDKNGMAIWLGNIGSLYADTKRYEEAEKYWLDALKLDREIGALNYERQFEEDIAALYTKMGRYQLAFEHYKKAMALKDTLFNEEKDKEITRKEMNYEFEKKEAAAKAEADKQAAVAAAESKKQKMVIWLVMVVLLVVVVFAGFIFRALRITQKQKKVIEQQKKLVEEKQKEILDSIRYAKRIQNALLPTEKYIDKILKRLMKK